MHMGTDDNGYELALCHQQAKRQNSVPAPVFQPIHPQFWGYLCLDFADTYAAPRPCYSAPPFFREARERTVNRRVYRKIFDRFDLSQVSDYKEMWKVNRNDKTYFSNGRSRNWFQPCWTLL